MKNKLGRLASLFVLGITALALTGCWGSAWGGSSYNSNACSPCYNNYAYTSDKPCAEPSTCSEANDECNSCGDHNSQGELSRSQIKADGVIVTAIQPKLCILGDVFVLDLQVQACRDLCEVEVSTLLPEGVSLIRSEPPGVEVNGRRLTWRFDQMKSGDCERSRVRLRADREGDLCACFCVKATPVQFCKILCAKPVIQCQKCGPEEVCPGDPVNYTITVTNTGTCPAEDVVVTDNVPDELEHSSGKKVLKWCLGTICPGETKTINVCFTACKRGTACNTILVTSCNATQCSDQFCTRICKECVEICKVGPEEVPTGHEAEYEITVTNPGDKPLTGVVVTDQAPAATSIVEAPGAEICGNRAVWRFDEIAPGEKEVMTIVLTSCTPGYTCNRVSVDNCQRCTDCAEACTRWKGRPAINVCVSDFDDPLCVGDPTSYTIRVTNQGTEEDSNVNVVVRFPSEIVPLTTTGPTEGTISGQTVTFAPYKYLGPRETICYRVDARAQASGDARIKVEVSSDAFQNPITQEESTIVN